MFRILTYKEKTQSIDFEIDCALFCELEFDFL